jgi:choline dehydrogenase-like flavoprotein
MVIGRSEDRDTPGNPLMLRHHVLVWDPICVTHLSQRSNRPHQKAGHMTAFDQRHRSCIPLASRGLSTYGSGCVGKTRRGPSIESSEWVMRWLFTGKGILTYSPSIVAASTKVLEESATPDMQVTFAPGSFKGGQIGELEETPGLSAGAWQIRLLSRGYVEAKSNRPGDMPAINPRYLPKETDHRAIIGDLAA